MPNEILLYTAEWCPDCRRAREFLDARGVEYQVVDLEGDPAAADRLVEATGKRGIPYLVVDGEWIAAYRPGGGAFPEQEILKALGLPD